MDEQYEALWLRGNRAAWKRLLDIAIRELGYPADEDGAIPLSAAKLASEREAAIATLRRLCDDLGDNDWPDDLHLSDIIEKHLARYWHT
jgi:hypothetical protein